jgi:ubiquinol-cytochrome c reductase cytochrome b subunit
MKKNKGYNREGPHNIDILSIIFGSLLGKGDVEKKKRMVLLRSVSFYQEAIHMKYSLLLYNQLKTAGYCK